MLKSHAQLSFDCCQHCSDFHNIFPERSLLHFAHSALNDKIALQFTDLSLQWLMATFIWEMSMRTYLEPRQSFFVGSCSQIPPRNFNRWRINESNSHVNRWLLRSFLEGTLCGNHFLLVNSFYKTQDCLEEDYLTELRFTSRSWTRRIVSHNLHVVVRVWLKT